MFLIARFVPRIAMLFTPLLQGRLIGIVHNGMRRTQIRLAGLARIYPPLLTFTTVVLPSEHGQPAAHISCIWQSAEGMAWVGTEK